MESKGHQFILVARNKEVTFQLLKSFNLPFISRGKGGKGYFTKFFYLLKAEAIIFKYSVKFKPDLFLSFGSTYAAHVSGLLGILHVTLDDTEHAKLDFFYIQDSQTQY